MFLSAGNQTTAGRLAEGQAVGAAEKTAPNKPSEPIALALWLGLYDKVKTLQNKDPGQIALASRFGLIPAALQAMKKEKILK
ncbi:hypothetical protein [Malonomonas rubra]|uniref:hypothetical protein n=1 Tax=Malonomonas rubra TaxID=57040 RepID=UPI0026F263F7|nr:hypothetical protein [Malonomonas rubra]